MVKDNKRKYIIILLLIIMATAVFYLCIEGYKVYVQKKQYAELSNFLYEDNEDIKENNKLLENQVTIRMQKLQELSKENSDIVAWIEIPNTTINYPVLQCDNNDFYLNHDYQKKSTVLGSIFIDKDVNIKKPSNNFLIYGHRNKSNMMFEELFRYKEEGFYEEHPKIRFTTLKDDSEYDIIASFYAKSYDINDSQDNTFKFYSLHTIICSIFFIYFTEYRCYFFI